LRSIAIAVAVLGALAATAGADEIVGVLHVEVSGVSETAAEVLESSLEDGLGNAGFKVAKRARMRELLDASGFPEGCRFGPCLQTVYKVTGVRLVLIARITGVGRNFSYLVTLVDTRTGTYTSQATDSCAVCTVNEAVATASIAVIGLVTGAGTGTVTEPGTDTTHAALDAAALREKDRALDDLLDRRQRSVTRGSIFLLGMAAIAGGVSATAFIKEDDDLGYGAAAAAGAFAISGGTLFVISRKF
jgi:hypothetical protein